MIELLARQRRALYFFAISACCQQWQAVLQDGKACCSSELLFAISTPCQLQRLPDCISVIGLVKCNSFRTRTHRINHTRRPLDLAQPHRTRDSGFGCDFPGDLCGGWKWSTKYEQSSSDRYQSHGFTL